jgi:hypothetical protein
MIAVALVAVLIGDFRWNVKATRAYRWMANEHARRRSNCTIPGAPGKAPMRINAFGEVISPERDRWHAALAAKYYRAALCPWLPVERDPPRPE